MKPMFAELVEARTSGHIQSIPAAFFWHSPNVVAIGSTTDRGGCYRCSVGIIVHA
jgi:hypothetical protein